MFQKCLAAFVDVPIGLVKITGIPRIFYVARVVGKIKKAVNFMLGIHADKSLDILNVAVIHRQDIIKMFVIGRANAPGVMLRTKDFKYYTIETRLIQPD